MLKSSGVDWARLAGGLNRGSNAPIEVPVPSAALARREHRTDASVLHTGGTTTTQGR
jgi:hypothetical protein